MAPELHLKMPYSGNLIDLFAAGIILFIMLSGHPPFVKADPRDPLYKLICTNKHENFWRFHDKNNKTNFCPNLKKLINSMLAFDPTQRLSIAEILANEWMKGYMKNEEEIVMEFRERKKKIEDRKRMQKKKEAEISLKKTNFYQVYGGCKQFRCDEKAEILVKLKNLYLEKREFSDLQVFFLKFFRIFFNV